MTHWLGPLWIALMFLILIAPHEAGHYLMAKLCRMGVKEFSVGIGPRLIAFTRGGTLYALRPILVAGYVRIAGMEPGNFAEPNGFHRRPAYQRLLVLLGGPLANCFMASLIVAGTLATQLNTPTGMIVDVQGDSPAAVAGIRPGDILVSVAGEPIHQIQDVRRVEDAHGGGVLPYVIRHPNGQVETIQVVSSYRPADQAYEIGIGLADVPTPTGILVTSVVFPVVVAGEVVAGIGELITNQVPGGVLGGEGATGPIGIGDMAAKAADQGVIEYLGLAALLSVALGLANLLPIPVLDGGRIVVVLLEKLRGRPFDREGELAVQKAALAVLVSLVLFISFFDVERILTNQFPTFSR